MYRKNVLEWIYTDPLSCHKVQHSAQDSDITTPSRLRLRIRSALHQSFVKSMTLATRKKLIGRPNHQEASSSYISCDNASRLAKAHVAYVICNDIPIRQAMNVRMSFSKRKRCKRTFFASQRRLPFCVSCKKRYGYILRIADSKHASLMLTP